LLQSLIYLVIGLFGGIASGFFGIGGGLVMVPLMVFAIGFAQKKAQGTSLAVILVPTGILAVLEYYKSGNVDIKAAAWLALGFFGGAFIGGKYANLLPGYILKRSFGIFLILVAVKMIWDSYHGARN
jgi:uncharacterized protein